MPFASLLPIATLRYLLGNLNNLFGRALDLEVRVRSLTISEDGSQISVCFAAPDKALKITRKTELVDHPLATIAIDWASKGPVGMEITLKENAR